MLFSLLGFCNQIERQCYSWFDEIQKHPDQQRFAATQHIQDHLPTLILMLEWRFRGYRHLKKSYRKKCHQNLVRLREDFESQLPTNLPPTQTAYLEAIRKYLQPGRFEYRESASFDTLMADPTKTVLVGDCNQLVCLYIWFFSLRFPVTDLHLKLIPGHVCLHHQGTDYETTNGQTTTYDNYTRIAHINELIAINLLDVADPQSTRFSRSPETQYVAARVSNAFSEDRQISQHNLRATQKNYVLDLTQNKRFEVALRVAKGDPQLSQYVLQHQALHLLSQSKFSKSRQIYRKIGSSEGQKRVDQTELNSLLQGLKNCRTIGDYKTHLSELKKIKRLAHRLHNQQIEDFCQKILGEIKKVT